MTFRRRLWDFLRTPFAWREVRDSGVWLYEENEITGARRALRVSRCYQPQDFDWLDGGGFDRRPRPPTTGSGVRVLPSSPCSLPVHECAPPRSREQEWS